MTTNINKDTLLRAARAYFLINDDPSAPSPAANAAALRAMDPKHPTNGWYCLGYTTKDQVVKIARSGGDATLVDTATEDGVDTIITPKSRTIDVDAMQLEVGTLDLAYNGSYNAVTGEYAVPTNANPLNKAVFVIIKTVKGKTISLRGFGSIATGDEPSLMFKELSKLPLRISLLTDDSGHNLYWGGDIINATLAGGTTPPAGGGTGGTTPPPANTDAAATATIDGTGVVTGFTVMNPGSGYTVAPAVNLISHDAGHSATAHAVVSSGGQLLNVVVDAPGTGYTIQPEVQLVRQ